MNDREPGLRPTPHLVGGRRSVFYGSAWTKTPSGSVPETRVTRQPRHSAAHP